MMRRLGIALAALAVWAGVLALFWGLMLTELRRGEQARLFESERRADALLRRLLEGQSLEAQGLPEELFGLAVYGADGRALVRLGEIPGELTGLRLSEGEVRFLDQGNGRVLFLKHLGVPWLRPRMPRMGEAPGPGGFRDVWRQRMGLRPRESGGMEQPGGSEPHAGAFQNSPLGAGDFDLAPAGLGPAGLGPSGLGAARVLALTARDPRGPDAPWRALAWGGTLVLSLAFGLLYWLWSVNRRIQAELLRREELVLVGEASRTLAHEIRNPLAAILLQARLAEGASPETSAVISEEVQRIETLVSRVKDLLKDPAGQAQNFDMGAWLETRARLWPNLTTQIGPDLRVRADPWRLEIALDNLIRNAREAQGDQGPPLELRAQRQGAWIRLEVLDRGPGLSPEVRRRLFSPFFSTKTQGMGLGLALARRFLEGAGGRLSLKNREPGPGALALAELPAAGEDSERLRP